VDCITIAGREIGPGRPVFIVAEVSANHLQDFDRAIETVRAAARCGADAVKFQTYTPDTITLNCHDECFKIGQGTLWDGKVLYNLYQEAYTPWRWYFKLDEEARRLGLICFSSPFDPSAVDFLDSHNAPAYKIASYEITDLPLIRYAASKGKPMIISTGVANIEDIESAVTACREAGNYQTALLKCTSLYPAPLGELNLKTIPDMAARFGVVVGFSDHSRSVSIPAAAVALGASIIEKHITLERSAGGPDAEFSLEPDEFAAMSAAVRDVEAALGGVSYELNERILKAREHSRSLFVVMDIEAGEVFTRENVRSIRPGFGLHPKHLDDVLGRKAAVDIKRGAPLKWEYLD
jgi:pseudaminic acid synthase